MTEDELYRLLRKRFTGNISTEEETKLEQWLRDSKENQETLDALSKVWQEKSVEPELVNSEAMIDYIWQQSQGKNKTRKIDWNYISKIAAVFVIFISIPVLVLNFIQDKVESPANVQVETIIKSNPAGQKAKFYLPDGSLVWLNGASELTYHSNFNESNRDIFLTGEAFFEVARNEDLPFQVSSGALTTTAIGTAFNVEAYPENEQIMISLLHGKVKVAINEIDNEVILDPGFQTNYESGNYKLNKQRFNESEIIGWKEGKLVLASANYQEVVDKLEKWYGVKITTNGNPPPNWRLSTTYQDESLRNILRNLRFGKEFNFKLGKDEVIINFK
ncbi:MAG: FecR family protein [Cyclobacteriaceae bacterium]